MEFTSSESVSALSSVEILRVSEAAWEVTTALPLPLVFSSAININNVLYLLGGIKPQYWKSY